VATKSSRAKGEGRRTVSGDGRSPETEAWCWANCPTYYGSSIEDAWQGAYLIWQADKEAGNGAAWKVAMPHIMSLTVPQRKGLPVQELLTPCYLMMTRTMEKYKPGTIEEGFDKPVGLSWYWRSRLAWLISDLKTAGKKESTHLTIDEDVTVSSSITHDQRVHLEELAATAEEEGKLAGKCLKIYIKAWTAGKTRPSERDLARLLGIKQTSVKAVMKEAMTLAWQSLTSIL